MNTIVDVMDVLKKTRQQLGYSVQDVVDYVNREAGIDVSPKTVYGWEEGNSKPDVPCFMAICHMYGVPNPAALFWDMPGTANLTESMLGFQRAINLLTTVRDGEYVGESNCHDSLSDNMKTEILYQLMDRAEKEGKKKDVTALKWAILQIERTK